MTEPTYVEFVVEQLSPLGTITVRSMFGGHGVYCEGIMFALIARGALYLKADDVNRPSFLGRGIEAFRPFPDKEGSMNYYPAPPEIFEDSEALAQWVGGAVEAAREGHGSQTETRGARKNRSSTEDPG